MKAIAIVEIMGSHYREGIFRAMDARWECDWYFGEPKNGIKEIAPGVLKRVSHVKVSDFLRPPLFWQSGTLPLLFNKRYSTLLIGGELWSVSTWLTLLLNRLMGRRKRIYLWSHGMYGREGFLKRLLKRAYFGMATGTLLYGNHACRLMTEAGHAPEKLQVIHNSLNYERQLQLRQSTAVADTYKEHFGNSRPTLIFIGRLNECKRIDMLISAVAKLRRGCEEYNLMIIGDGPERTRLEEMAREAGVNAWFYGACHDEAVNARLITDADLCVSPGEIGLTAMHVLMFGVPAVTHNDLCHQMPEFEAIKEGVTGAFFKAGDVNSLADTIHHWFVRHAADRQAVRQACYNEIDTAWNPAFQMDVLSRIIEES